MDDRKPEKAVLLFIDGLGVGPEDRERNPMARVMGPCLRVFSGGKAYPLLRGGIARPLDAGLGLEGLPQSATGQTALLTGINAAAALKRHVCGFPNRALREMILERSFLKRAREAGRSAAFINAFRPLFFEMGDEVWEKLPLSVTTWINHAAGLPFFSLKDLANRRAVYQEFTNHALRRRGFDVPLWTPAEAGRVLAGRILDFDLLLYEYFRTDAAGHSQDMERAEREIRRLEEFLEAFLEKVDLDRTLVVLSSDHGNIEDLSVRTHTLNPALTILWGPGAGKIAARMRSITDVPREMLRALGIEEA